MITLHTNKGDIELELDTTHTPKTAENFLQYAKSGFYDGVIFHRVIKNFMVQGGGFDQNMQQKKTLAPIENEADKGGKNLRGTIAMARTADPHSASAQFFINTVDNGFLDHKGKHPNTWGYCVFGHVTKGMDVVDRIQAVSTGSFGGHQDVPHEPIVIEKVTISEA